MKQQKPVRFSVYESIDSLRRWQHRFVDFSQLANNLVNHVKQSLCEKELCTLGKLMSELNQAAHALDFKEYTANLHGWIERFNIYYTEEQEIDDKIFFESRDELADLESCLDPLTSLLERFPEPKIITAIEDFFKNKLEPLYEREFEQEKDKLLNYTKAYRAYQKQQYRLTAALSQLENESSLLPEKKLLLKILRTMRRYADQPNEIAREEVSSAKPSLEPNPTEPGLSVALGDERRLLNNGKLVFTVWFGPPPKEGQPHFGVDTLAASVLANKLSHDPEASVSLFCLPEHQKAYIDYFREQKLAVDVRTPDEWIRNFREIEHIEFQMRFIRRLAFAGNNSFLAKLEGLVKEFKQLIYLQKNMAADNTYLNPSDKERYLGASMAAIRDFCSEPDRLSTKTYVTYKDYFVFYLLSRLRLSRYFFDSTVLPRAEGELYLGESLDFAPIVGFERVRRNLLIVPDIFALACAPGNLSQQAIRMANYLLIRAPFFLREGPLYSIFPVADATGNRYYKPSDIDLFVSGILYAISIIIPNDGHLASRLSPPSPRQDRVVCAENVLARATASSINAHYSYAMDINPLSFLFLLPRAKSQEGDPACTPFQKVFLGTHKMAGSVHNGNAGKIPQEISSLGPEAQAAVKMRQDYLRSQELAAKKIQSIFRTRHNKPQATQEATAEQVGP